MNEGTPQRPYGAPYEKKMDFIMTCENEDAKGRPNSSVSIPKQSPDNDI